MWSKLWKPASSVLGTLWSKPPRPCHHNSQLEIILRFWNRKIFIILSPPMMTLNAQKIESLLSLRHQLWVYENTARQQKTTSPYNKHQPKWLVRKRWWTNWNHDPLERCLTTRYKRAPRWSNSKPSMPLAGHHGVCFFYVQTLPVPNSWPSCPGRLPLLKTTC